VWPTTPTLGSPITEAKLSFLVPQFMEAPEEALLPESLEPGASYDIELNALFTDSILEISEATKVTAEVPTTLSPQYAGAIEVSGDGTTMTIKAIRDVAERCNVFALPLQQNLPTDFQMIG